MKHRAWIGRLAGISLCLATCGGAQAGEAPETACQEMAGKYQLAEAFISEAFLELARGILAEAGRPSKDDGDEPDAPFLSLRLTDGVFTISTPGRRDTAKIPAARPPGNLLCLLQLESSPDTLIVRTDFRTASDEEMQQLSSTLSYQWLAEVTPEQARSLSYFMQIYFNIPGAANGALIVPLEKIGEDAVR
ncbi:MAG: hypothetical protein LBF93_06810 [Zoogloeaceae bacterium]|jgi:hypothetical protein|nr:hypothetical protein [Zoogloeaceae bacterium]